MWKRDQGVRTTGGREAVPSAAPAPGNGVGSIPAHAGTEAERRPMDRRDVASIGKSVVIHGELSGSEDLTIEGNVEGQIELKENILTIGPNGKIKAEVYAKVVVVLGQVIGNIMASEKVDIRDNGSVEGDVLAPRIAISEGAHFRGAVDMQKKVDLPRGAEAPATPAVVTSPAKEQSSSVVAKPALLDMAAPPPKPGV